jgi:hypothetical protein
LFLKNIFKKTITVVVFLAIVYLTVLRDGHWQLNSWVEACPLASWHAFQVKADMISEIKGCPLAIAYRNHSSTA